MNKIVFETEDVNITVHSNGFVTTTIYNPMAGEDSETDITMTSLGRLLNKVCMPFFEVEA